MYRCPKCNKKLLQRNNSYQCENRHTFDIARRGYVNFVVGSSRQHGDDKEMIRSRTEFLTLDHYAILRNKLAQLLVELQPSTVVDAGCGEGYYTNYLAKQIPDAEIYGFDLSKVGIDYACRAKTEVYYAVANVVHLPLVNDFVDVLLSVFAPYEISEVKRIVHKDGYFIKVGPGARHLYQLKEILYKEVYENVEDTLDCEDFELWKEICLTDEIHVVGQKAIHALFQMTPYYWKSPKEGSERLRQVEVLDSEIAFVIQIYKRK